jgi:UDP-glucuronate decarboxylase
MKRVLVTGASGFIGRQSLEPLVNRGYDVHAVSHQEIDLLNLNDRKKVMAEIQPTHVLHFAWIATPGVYWTSPLNAEWLEATKDLLRLSREQGVTRFVASGTCMEAPEYSTPYGEAKTAAKATVIDADGLSTAWGRIFFLYGPHESPKRLVPAVINALLDDQPAHCTHGQQVRDFLHVQDVAEAFVALLDSDVTGVVDIGSGIPITIKDVVEEIARQIGKPELIQLGAIEAPANEPAELVAKIERLRDEVGWSPRFTLEQGIADTIEWWMVRQAHHDGAHSS